MDDTSELVESLMNPEAYDEPATSVEVVQTHISFVFLTDNFVYKVKKPVDYGFLDYTTLEKRRFYCEEEIRVNRKLCRELYLGVVAIKRDKEGRILVDGEGEVIDYAVKMKREPEEAIMTRLLQRGKVKKEHIEKIAAIVSEFHRAAEAGPEILRHGSFKQVEANWVQNFEQTQSLRGPYLNPGEYDTLKKKVFSFMEDKKTLFEERIKKSRIRECHGDLHSGNIFILPDDRICIFDAIEFFKGFSCCDVASEVAFLVMDLEFQGRRDLSDYFVKKYIEHGRDRGILGLLDFYLCYRAYVRAKVNGFKIFDPSVGGDEKKASVELTKRYFHLAKKYSSRL